jgi:hypothetical protein
MIRKHAYLVADFEYVPLCAYSPKGCVDLNAASYKHAGRLEDMHPAVLTFTAVRIPNLITYLILCVLCVHKISQSSITGLHIVK